MGSQNLAAAILAFLALGITAEPWYFLRPYQGVSPYHHPLHHNVHPNVIENYNHFRPPVLSSSRPYLSSGVLKPYYPGNVPLEVQTNVIEHPFISETDVNVQEQLHGGFPAEYLPHKPITNYLPSRPTTSYLPPKPTTSYLLPEPSTTFPLTYHTPRPVHVGSNAVEHVHHHDPVLAAAPVPKVTVNQFHSQDDFGGYNFGYTADSSSRHESKDAHGTVRGTFSYVDPNGELQRRDYVADHLGFRVRGTNVHGGRRKRSLAHYYDHDDNDEHDFSPRYTPSSNFSPRPSPYHFPYYIPNSYYPSAPRRRSFGYSFSHQAPLAPYYNRRFW